MWVGNIICCWQLLQWAFNLRSFDDKHAGIERDHGHVELKSRSIGGHTKNSTWYARMIDKATQRPVEVDSVDGSMSGTTLQEDKRFFDPVVTENKWVSEDPYSISMLIVVELSSVSREKKKAQTPVQRLISGIHTTSHRDMNDMQQLYE